MASITDLRQKRAALWEKTKKFLDKCKTRKKRICFRQEDVETYEKWRVKLLLLGKRR